MTIFLLMFGMLSEDGVPVWLIALAMVLDALLMATYMIARILIPHV